MAVLATTGPSATELRSLFRRIVQAGLRSSRSMPVISGPEAVDPRFQILYAQMTSNPRHSLPPRLMAHQPTRFATAQESTPSPSPGIRIRGVLPLRPGGDRYHAGPGHDRRARQLPPRDPDRAGQG